MKKQGEGNGNGEQRGGAGGPEKGTCLQIPFDHYPTKRGGHGGPPLLLQEIIDRSRHVDIPAGTTNHELKNEPRGDNSAGENITQA